MTEPNKPQTTTDASLRGDGLGNIDDQRGHPGKGSGSDTVKQAHNASFPDGEKTEPHKAAAEGTRDNQPVRDNSGREPDIGSVHAAAGNDRLDDRSDRNLYERLAEKDATPTQDAGW